jgi:hypothetical protein
MTEVSRSTSQAQSKKPQLQSAAPVLPPPQPFKPHRKLFAIIGVILFAWLAVLLTLYFTTVYPHRNDRVEYPGENIPVAPTPANPQMNSLR